MTGSGNENPGHRDNGVLNNAWHNSSSPQDPPSELSPRTRADSITIQPYREAVRFRPAIYVGSTRDLGLLMRSSQALSEKSSPLKTPPKEWPQ